ncbi:rhodanese-related sulfurtransferase [Streptomyces sp. SAI-208]|uniref:rhodanese-like domain-containing protein n=1 Tax=unclassified Streptomyces TaxID=2593676 RepID=UPI0024765D1D|nr:MULTISPECIES: rhodanese-like domain-containing protein [unclassified Streptomyces]MDH6553906.1 rhodanese-related sulfurtransferase [Streptomyces sp. SAI-041]MDH6572984.1 rhodanese-related sulfurtransferase [Streptomyces sp. SAI-117]MDH6582054.1 rhodanese-related sulfurtransferase [Streptomyces sp. SAI-133]MDH6612684.1 rhodanese-related sulfurtransferase [Streptomyces sp. SAI-208]
MAREVTQEAFAAAWADGALVIDVREADEYAAGHVPGARLMALRTVPARCGELPVDRPVFVICASGNRSMMAADWMNSQGIDACSVTGGTTAWARAGRPVAAGSHEHAA